MKRILTTTLVALLATLTPAFAAGRTNDGAQMIELQLTKHGSVQNAAGTAKITFGDNKPGQTFGLVMTASVPDDKEYGVVLVTKKGEVHKAGIFTTYLGSGSIKLFLEELPSDIVSVTDILGLSIVDSGGIVLEGTFSAMQPQG